MHIFTVAVLLLLFFGVYFILVEQHQANTSETKSFPTLNTFSLSDSCLDLRYHKKKRELCYPIQLYCVPWSGASPQARDPQHWRDPKQKGGCSASHHLHHTDWQNHWGGKAPLGITKSNPLPKAGSLKGSCLGPCPGGFWWSPRNAVLHIIFHTYVV